MILVRLPTQIGKVALELTPSSFFFSPDELAAMMLTL